MSVQLFRGTLQAERIGDGCPRAKRAHLVWREQRRRRRQFRSLRHWGLKTTGGAAYLWPDPIDESTGLADLELVLKELVEGDRTFAGKEVLALVLMMDPQ
ncbi:hypothetical protein HNR46_003031 [Haloferula luteola]|uniref:Uncharacterized protein n=1 Tax=Haloferula luteola TaxID=595692 RepID=A0A840V592_9BACT|nr:hypothetical protein [Haloferula luteola]MBB5352783.1 hypothetical protein [Haloferula luteola]